jgi:hypothetical protein
MHKLYAFTKSPHFRYTPSPFLAQASLIVSDACFFAINPYPLYNKE